MDDLKGLEQRARMLGNSVLISLGLLLIWSLFFLWGLDFAHRIHGALFTLSKDTLAIVFYCGIGLFKVLALGLFFIPWLATRIEIRRLHRRG
jgi:hypothetical protein